MVELCVYNNPMNFVLKKDYIDIESAYSLIRQLYLEKKKNFDAFCKDTGIPMSKSNFFFWVNEESQEVAKKIGCFSENSDHSCNTLETIKRIERKYGISCHDKIDEKTFSWLSCWTYSEYLNFCKKHNYYPFFIHDYKNKYFDMTNSLTDNLLSEDFKSHLVDNSYIELDNYFPCLGEYFAMLDMNEENEFVEENYECLNKYIDEEGQYVCRCRFSEKECLEFREKVSKNLLKGSDMFEYALGFVSITGLDSTLLHSVCKELIKFSVVYDLNLS